MSGSISRINNSTIDEARIRIYGSVTLSNGAIVRATSNCHNKECFSEVAISMSSEESDDYISDQGVCYGQVSYMFKIFFFFQAEDGIRDYKVTGVQTCALPI